MQLICYMAIQPLRRLKGGDEKCRVRAGQHAARCNQEGKYLSLWQQSLLFVYHPHELQSSYWEQC